jgi:hypothetical protein
MHKNMQNINVKPSLASLPLSVSLIKKTYLSPQRRRISILLDVGSHGGHQKISLQGSVGEWKSEDSSNFI